MFRRDRIELKSTEEMLLMRRAGLVVADALDAVRAATVPGVSTVALDGVAAEVIARAGAAPSFLGYQGYPASICVSVNDEVVHGIPGARTLAAGDVVSVDCGAIVDGWHADAAMTVVLPDADPADVALCEITESAMWDGIAALQGAERLHAVGAAIEASVAESGTHPEAERPYGIVREYVGHGIGSAMHQAPDVPNYRPRDRGPRVRPGMCVAIEPMITRGEPYTQVCEDDWTVVTDDGARAAHWEHTVAIHDGGLWVLTARDGGHDRLAERGVSVAPLAAE